MTALAAGKAGVFAATDTILHRYHFGKFTPIKGVVETTDGRINDLFCGSDESLWISCENAVIKRWRNGVVTTYTNKDNLNVGISRLYEDPKGILWVASQRGLQRLSGDSFQTVPSRKGGMGFGVAYCAAADQEGSLWVGLESDGLARLRVNQLRTLTADDGLPSDSTRSVFQDSEGIIWVGTANGFAGFKNGRTWSYKEVDGEPIGAVLAFAEDKTGALWIGAGHEVLIMKKSRLAKLPGWKRVPEIKVICRDGKGQMWVGTDGDGLFEFGNGTMRAYRVENGLAGNQIRAILSDKHGALWIATMGEGICRLSDGKWTTYTTRDGLASNRVVAIHEGNDGSIWFATREGLCRLKDGKFATIRIQNGLRENFIYAVLDDGIDHLWFSCASGLFRARRADLNAVADGRLKTLATMDYGEKDGLLTRAFNVGNWPNAWRTREGLLLFCSMKGIVIADPRRVFSNTLIPPVHVEAVKINNQVMPVDRLPSTPAGAGEVEIHYAALSYQAAEKIRFRYMLEGFNQEWVDAGTRRFVYYANLSPGLYRFRVKACNNNGVWNETGASYAFSLKPNFYQTWYFYVLVTVIMGVAAWAAYQLRLHELKARYSAVLDERNRIAREIHDTLAQNLAGIALQLDSVTMQTTGIPPELRRHLDQACNLTRYSLAEARGAVLDLRSQELERQELTALLPKMAESIRENAASKTLINVKIRGVPRPLSPVAVKNLLRIFQEAVANAIKHANATRVEAELEFDGDRLTLRVRDDGCGFDADQTIPLYMDHYGLIGMRERAIRIGGRLTLNSRPGEGTEIVVQVPLPA